MDTTDTQSAAEGFLLLEIVFYRADDGRWIAEIPNIPGCLAYGVSMLEVERQVLAIADHGKYKRGEHKHQKKVFEIYAK